MKKHLVGFLIGVLVFFFSFWFVPKTEIIEGKQESIACTGYYIQFFDDGKLFIKNSQLGIFEKENPLFMKDKGLFPVTCRGRKLNQKFIFFYRGDKVCFPEGMSIRIQTSSFATPSP